MNEKEEKKVETTVRTSSNKVLHQILALSEENINKAIANTEIQPINDAEKAEEVKKEPVEHEADDLHQPKDIQDEPLDNNNNNEADLDRAQAAANMRMLKQSAPTLVRQLQFDMAQGTLSNSTIEEACNTLLALAK